MASQYGHAATVQLLLLRKAAVDVEIEGGATALHLACQGGYADAAELLLAQGAAANTQVDSGWSTLMLSSRSGHSNVVRVLLSHGAVANAQMNTGQNALHFACQYGHEAVVRLLLGAKADVTPQPLAAKSPSKALPSAIRVASKFGNEGIAKLLSDHQLVVENGGFSASGAMLPMLGVPFDAATQRFYFSPGVYADLDPSHFAWGCSDFTLTATITPRVDGRITATGEYAVLYIKSDHTEAPFVGPSCIVYNSGMVQFRLARTPELGQENKGLVQGGWRSGVPVTLTLIRQADQLYIFQDSDQIAFQCVTPSFDVGTTAPLRIGGNHVNPKYHNLDAYLSGLSSQSVAAFPARNHSDNTAATSAVMAPPDLA
jgi:hypothetical protein